MNICIVYLLMSTACENPLPAFQHGNYSFDEEQIYTHGEIVKFTCDAGTTPYPENNQIECTTTGWRNHAKCLKGKSLRAYIC